MALNNAGQVIGADTFGGGFLYNSRTGVEQYLGFTPAAISSNGIVVGNGFLYNGVSAQQTGFFYNGGSVKAFTGPYGATNFSLSGVNSSGEAVGYADFPTPINSYRAAETYSGGVWSQLTGFPPNNAGTQATGINDAGQIVGAYYAVTSGSFASGSYSAISRPFELSNGTVRDLGDLGGGGAWATAVNAIGPVAGISATGGALHVFLYDSGEMHDLSLSAAVNDAAYGLNDLGQVVGFGLAAAGYTRVAVGGPPAVLFANGTVTGVSPPFDYNVGGLEGMTAAYGINDSGQIVGRALVLTEPGDENPEWKYVNILLTPTPEPSTLALAALGFSALAAWKLRHRFSTRWHLYQFWQPTCSPRSPLASPATASTRPLARRIS
jgi:uncharacterized membrane protein